MVASASAALPSAIGTAALKEADSHLAGAERQPHYRPPRGIVMLIRAKSRGVIRKPDAAITSPSAPRLTATSIGGAAKLLTPARLGGRGCVLGPLPVMLAACQTVISPPSITSPDVPSALLPAGPTRYAYLPRRSP